MEEIVNNRKAWHYLVHKTETHVRD